VQRGCLRGGIFRVVCSMAYTIATEESNGLWWYSLSWQESEILERA